MDPWPGADDLAVARATRAARRSGRPGGRAPRLVLVSDEPTDAEMGRLAAAGWELHGILATDPFSVLLTAPLAAARVRSYVDGTELLADAAVDGVCVDVEPATAGPLLAAALRAGLCALLRRPQRLDPGQLRDALEGADETRAEHAVGFSWRFRPGPVQANRMLRDGRLRAVVQVTVRGWPTDPAGLAELADLVGLWFGAVAAVCAAPGALPARALPDGPAVRCALLTEAGTTVLVAAGGTAAPELRLSGVPDRLVVTAQAASWTRAASGVPGGGGEPDDGLVATAGALAVAATGVDPDRLGGRPDELGPPAATLRDLLVASAVVDALDRSAALGQWVELG